YMNELITVAFVRFLAAECVAHPMLFVLDDLQWGDAFSLRLLDVALRELSGQPLFILALGRPEVNKLFPRLWSEHNMQVLRLEQLPRTMATLLVSSVL